MKRKEQKWNNSFLIFLCIWESSPSYLFMFYIFRKSALLMLLNVWGKQVFRPIIGRSPTPSQPQMAKSRSVLTKVSLMTFSTLKRRRRTQRRTRAYWLRQENQNLVIVTWPESVPGRSIEAITRNLDGPSVGASKLQNPPVSPLWTVAGSGSACSSSATSGARRPRRSWSATTQTIPGSDWTSSRAGSASAAKMSDSGCSTGLTAVSCAGEM